MAPWLAAWFLGWDQPSQLAAAPRPAHEPAAIQASLAMFETGATQPGVCRADLARGRSGEVSRYQILPSVWREYSRSKNYTNPDTAWSVASQILTDRIARFRVMAGRMPDAQEVYLLWNKPGHFEACGFSVPRVRVLFRHRAQRYANLWSSMQPQLLAQGNSPAASVTRGRSVWTQ